MYEMEKGLVILFIVFVSIAILHFISIRMIRVAESKKAHYRKVFWYFYGIAFSLSGIINLIEKETLNFVFLLQSIIGIVMIALNFMGKIETKNPT